MRSRTNVRRATSASRSDAWLRCEVGLSDLCDGNGVAAILELHARGVSRHEIARALQVSRPTVRKVLRSNSTKVPEIRRKEKAEPYRQQILDLLAACKGNLVRVHEELVAGGAALSYPALTAFCRRQGIGQEPVAPSGR